MACCEIGFVGTNNFNNVIKNDEFIYVLNVLWQLIDSKANLKLFFSRSRPISLLILCKDIGRRSLLAASCGLLATPFGLLATSCRLLAGGYWLLVIARWLLEIPDTPDLGRAASALLHFCLKLPSLNWPRKTKLNWVGYLLLNIFLLAV